MFSSSSISFSDDSIKDIIENEKNNLLLIEESFKRSTEITQNMFSLLDNFQNRLNDLEKEILPVYKSTEKTRGVYENIDGVITEIEKISSIFKSTNNLQQQIKNGPRGDFEQYGNNLKEIERSSKFLRTRGCSFASTPIVLQELEKLEEIAERKCDEALINLISKQSIPIDPVDKILSKIKKFKGISTSPPKGSILMSQDKLNDIITLSNALELISHNFKWKRELIVKRKQFILQSLQKLQTNQSLHSFISGKKKKQNIHPFIELFICIIPLFEGEKEFVTKLLPNEWQTIFSGICESSIDYLIETGELLIKDYQNVSVFMRAPLLDILVYIKSNNDRMHSIFDYLEGVRYLSDIEKFLQQIQSSIKNSFNQIEEEIRTSHFYIRESATVDQLTSNVLTFLVKISEHKQLVTKLLYNTDSGDFYSKYLHSVLTELVKAIKNKANEEKNTSTKSIYALNNIQYILTKIKTSTNSFEDLLPNSFFEMCEKEISHFNNTYKTGWNKCISLLMDKNMMKKGKLEKRLKSQIQEFNQEFEDMFHSQQQFVITDKELRIQIISELKLVINPCYEAFYGRVKQSSISTDNSLMKYPPKVMDGMLDKLLIGKASTMETSISKKKLLSKLHVNKLV